MSVEEQGMSIEDWSALIQALGVVVTVAVTAYLSRSDARERRSSKEAGARTVALRIRADVRSALQSVEWFQGQLQAGASPHSIGSDEQGTFGIGRVGLAIDHARKLLEQTGELGQASMPLQHALLALDVLDDRLDAYIGTDDPPDLYYNEDLWPSARQALDEASSRLRIACTAIDELFIIKKRKNSWLRWGRSLSP